MPAITSFHGAAVQPEELSGIMADYLALERARVFRRLLVMRCGLVVLALAVIGGVLRVLPPFATWVSLAMFVTPPVWAWIVELRRDRRLARRLEQVPGGVTHEVLPISGVRKA